MHECTRRGQEETALRDGAVLPAALELGLYDGALHARCHLTPGIPARHIRH